jgi:hypothetical protein
MLASACSRRVQGGHVQLSVSEPRCTTEACACSCCLFVTQISAPDSQLLSLCSPSLTSQLLLLPLPARPPLLVLPPLPCLPTGAAPVPP